MSTGCSLDDAFPDGIEKPPKKKRSATKGPSLSFLKGIGGDSSDPDRPFVSNGIPQDVEVLRGKEGFANKDDATVDIIGKSKGPGQGQEGMKMDSYNHSISSYFGKSETDESHSQFSPSVKDTNGYKLGVDFPTKMSLPAIELGTSANTNNAWKPTSSYPNRGGVETAFFKETRHDNEPADAYSDDLKEQHAMLRRQIDTLFARLENMEHRRSEFSHSELGLFILTGLFLMFGMDSIRKFR